MNIEIQKFTTVGADTWTKPANALWHEVLLVNGGNGGNGGGYSFGSLIGNAGDPGNTIIFKIPASFLPDTVAIVVGAGGKGGAGSVGDSPSSGDAGEYSYFAGLYTSSLAWNNITPNNFFDGIISTGIVLAGPGGSGGEIDSAGNVGISSLTPFWDGAETTYRFDNFGTGGAAGVNGTAGGNMDAGGAGGGGGGGAVTATSKGGNGGKGGAYGGGGGGGGSGDGTFTGGDGGAGGDGVVIVKTIYEGSSGGGLSAQQTRDAMKLAPSTGAGITGSIDDLLITTGVALKNDAITASKFDESTAFPLTATDSGSTYLARTGADSDTLETLSDQIDAVPTTTEFELRTLPAADYVVVTDTIATVTTLTNAPTGMALEATLTAIKGAGWTTETLVAILAAIGSAGLTAQQVRDAMKLAPTAGSPSAGSVDAHLDSLIAGVSGAGAVECAITVNDGTNPVDGAEVWVTTDASGTNTVASGTSDALGLVTVWLDAGSYYVWKQLAGYTFTNPQVMVVT